MAVGGRRGQLAGDVVLDAIHARMQRAIGHVRRDHGGCQARRFASGKQTVGDGLCQIRAKVCNLQFVAGNRAVHLVEPGDDIARFVDDDGHIGLQLSKRLGLVLAKLVQSRKDLIVKLSLIVLSMLAAFESQSISRAKKQ